MGDNPLIPTPEKSEGSREGGRPFEARPALDGVKKAVEKKSLKESLGTWLKDPEKRKEALAAGIAGLMMYLFKNEKTEIREKARERGEKDALKMEVGGEIEDTMKGKSEEERVAVESKEVSEKETVTELRLLAVNIDAALNKRNAQKLAEMGIRIPKAVSKLGSIGLLKGGLGSYEEFENHVCETLQPQIKDRKKQIENVAQILGRCALGKYQILAMHHFDSLGWEWKGAEGLKNMYQFLRSNEKQNDLNKIILTNNWKRFDGNIQAIAAAYYGGPESGAALVKYQEAKKSGKLKGMEWLEDKQTMGKYGSILHYSESVKKNYDSAKKNYPELSDMDALQRAIARQETGYLAGKQAVPQNVA